MSEDIYAEILAELRKLKRAFYIILIFIFVGSLPAFYAASKRSSTSENSWARVKTAMDRQDFPEALSMSQALVRREPEYSYGHAWLGAIYLAMGDLTNSEEAYLRAYQLMPIEEYEKDLAAVRKRMAGGSSFKLMSTTAVPAPILQN